jgi:hypothetical protein
MEGIELAVLFPTMGLSFLPRDNMDPRLYPSLLRKADIAAKRRDNLHAAQA